MVSTNRRAGARTVSSPASSWFDVPGVSSFPPPPPLPAGHTARRAPAHPPDVAAYAEAPSSANSSTLTEPARRSDPVHLDKNSLKSHLEKPLRDFTFALRHVTEEQGAALADCISRDAPSLLPSFSAFLDGLAQVRKARAVLANQQRRLSRPLPSAAPSHPPCQVLAHSCKDALFAPLMGPLSFSATAPNPPAGVPFATHAYALSAASSEDATATSQAAHSAPSVADEPAVGSRNHSGGERDAWCREELKKKDYVALMDPPSRSAWAAERFNLLQQCPCKEFAVNLIKQIDPKKQKDHPYRMKGNDLPARPRYWPNDVTVRHDVTPSHLKKDERVKLLVHFLFLPDNDKAFYEEWRHRAQRSRGLRHNSWADMLNYVVSITTFRTDGPRRKSRSKGSKKEKAVDEEEEDLSDDEQLDRSKFDVSLEESGRINARLELMDQLISAASHVEDQCGGGVSRNKTRMPSLPTHFLEREVAFMMRRKRGEIKQARKRKREEDATVTVPPPNKSFAGSVESVPRFRGANESQDDLSTTDYTPGSIRIPSGDDSGVEDSADEDDSDVEGYADEDLESEAADEQSDFDNDDERPEALGKLLPVSASKPSLSMSERTSFIAAPARVGRRSPRKPRVHPHTFAIEMAEIPQPESQPMSTQSTLSPNVSHQGAVPVYQNDPYGIIPHAAPFTQYSTLDPNMEASGFTIPTSSGYITRHPSYPVMLPEQMTFSSATVPQFSNDFCPSFEADVFPGPSMQPYPTFQDDPNF